MAEFNSLSSTSTSSASTVNGTNYSALSTLTTVFFFWGFIASGNTVFIPFCKSYFNLDQFQSQLIDFAFYGAYYLGALLLFLISVKRKSDVVGNWGYKKTIVLGLIFSAVGAIAMVLCVLQGAFAGMLLGLFIVALGFSLQQTSANPFMIMLGDEKTGATRITLGGAVNSLGSMIGPIVISLVLFGTTAAISEEQIQQLSLNKVSILYGCVGFMFLCIALMFKFSKKVPEAKVITEDGGVSSENQKALNRLLILTGFLIIAFSPVFYSYKGDLTWTNAEAEWVRIIGWTIGLLVVVVGLLLTHKKAAREKKGWGAMQFPQLTMGMLAIFVYVGAEVTVGSNLGELLKDPKFGGYDSSQLAPFVSLYWGSLMIGRWTGAVVALNISENIKRFLRFTLPFLAFGIVLLVSYLTGYTIDNLYLYVVCVLVQMLAFIWTKDKPAFTLLAFALLNALAIIIGMTTSGIVATYAIMSTGLFCSIMWSSIFSLAIGGLGKFQTQGSAFLVMMILGGAVIPPLQGKLADIIGIQQSYIIAAVSFLFLAFYAFWVKKVLHKQGHYFE